MIKSITKFFDERGWFAELYKKNEDSTEYLQDNISFSKKGVIRGLHFQITPNAQEKYITVLSGEIIDVILNIDPNSDEYGQYKSFHMKSGDQLVIPDNYAHGFHALEDTYFLYKCSNVYDKNSECSYNIRSIPMEVWGVSDVNSINISEKDKNAKLFPYK